MSSTEQQTIRQKPSLNMEGRRHEKKWQTEQRHMNPSQQKSYFVTDFLEEAITFACSAERLLPSGPQAVAGWWRKGTAPGYQPVVPGCQEAADRMLPHTGTDWHRNPWPRRQRKKERNKYYLLEGLFARELLSYQWSTDIVSDICSCAFWKTMICFRSGSRQNNQLY